MCESRLVSKRSIFCETWHHEKIGFYGFYTKLRRWGWLPHRQACRPSANHHLNWQVWWVRRSPFGASCSTIWDPFWPISWWKNWQTKGLSIVSHQGDRKILAISRCPFLGKKLKPPFRPTWYIKPRLDGTRDQGLTDHFLWITEAKVLEGWIRASYEALVFFQPKMGGEPKIKKNASSLQSDWESHFSSKFRAI